MDTEWTQNATHTVTHKSTDLAVDTSCKRGSPELFDKASHWKQLSWLLAQTPCSGHSQILIIRARWSREPVSDHLLKLNPVAFEP